MSELIQAVKDNDLSLVKELLNNGDDVNEKTERKGTPLHFAAGICHTAIVKLLLEKGADVNARDDLGWTPLHLAIWNDKLQNVKLLLASGADINICIDKYGSILHFTMIVGEPEISELLIKRTQDLNKTNNDGLTPLHLAVQFDKSENAHLLRLYGANEIDIFQAVKDNNIISVKELLKIYGNVNKKSFHDNTPLHWAVMKGHTEIVQLLINNGADVNAKNDQCITPLHIASIYGHAAIVRILINEKANVNAWSYEGDALYYARATNHTGIANMLIDHGAEYNVKLRFLKIFILYLRKCLLRTVNFFFKKTPSDIARKYGSNEIVKLLKKHGAIE